MAWIAAVALLLAGIVALNVAVLRLNVEADRLDVAGQKLAAENAALASDLSRATAVSRIESVAIGKLRLVPAAETTYVHVGRKKR